MMGPLPHDAPPPVIDEHNPMGTDEFEFVEYAHPQPQALHRLRFLPVAKHRERERTAKLSSHLAQSCGQRLEVNRLLESEPA